MKTNKIRNMTTTTQPQSSGNRSPRNRPSTPMVTTMNHSMNHTPRPDNHLTLVTVFALVGLFAATSMPTWAAGNAHRALGKSRIVGQGLDQGPAIWTDPGRTNSQANVLNPDGDINGDLYPTVVNNPLDPRDIWVVWSKFTGTNHDLAWSSWEAAAWREIEWVDYKPRVGNDFDPVLKFSVQQRPFLVWWTEFDGQGEVYVSLFLETHWLAPFRVSPPNVDSRRPQIRRIFPQSIEVEFETPDGILVQVVGRVRPHTITDDINPQMHWSLRGDPVNIASQP